MRCKPGDIARIIDAPRTREIGMVDRLVKVTHRVYSVYWAIEHPIPMGNDEFAAYFHDSLLRPIRDPGDDAQDETLTWLPTPSTPKEIA